MKRSLLLILLATAGLPVLVAAAPIYRCAGAGGATVFSQVPCGNDAAKVGADGAKTTASAGAPNAAGEKAALGEIDSRCEAASHRILDGYAAKFAEANASIADLHKRSMTPGTGEGKDADLQKQIQALEAHKTDLLDVQDRELSSLRNQCQAERTAEQKRQSDRALVKR